MARNGTPIDPGIVARAAQGQIYDANGQVYFGPGEPVAPVVPEDTPERLWDFPFAWNTYRTSDNAKSQDARGVTFTQLRMLSYQTHVRAVIETVKDKQSKIDWTFTLEPAPGEPKAQTEKRARSDSRVAEVAKFFETPDGEHEFAEWIRLLLEDVIVLDALSIVKQDTISGVPLAFEIFDGATMLPLLDIGGRTPRPPEWAYQQYIKGIPFANFTTDEMLYAPRNPRAGHVFGFGPVEQLLFYINIAMRKDASRLAHYTDGNVPAGLLPMPADWSAKQISDWYSSFNAMVAGNIQSFVKMLPIPSGIGKPIFPQLDMLADSWEETWLRLVCFVFSVSPSSILHQQNRATSDTAREQADEEGEKVYTDFIRRKLNQLIRKWFGYDDIVARPKFERTLDPKEQSAIDAVYLATGKAQINELRARDGEDPLPELVGVNGYVNATSGFTSFASALATADAKLKLAENPPPAPAPFGQQPSGAEQPGPRRVSVPTAAGKVLRFNAGDMVLTKARGSVPVDELVTGDELVTVQKTT
jgi:hypothetical protein